MAAVVGAGVAGVGVVSVGVVGVGGDVAGETTGVDDVMVVGTQERGVVEVGPATVGPVDEVVGVAPAGRPGAVGEGAALVAVVEGPDLGTGEEPTGAADQQRAPGVIEDDRVELGVAGQKPRGGDREVAPGVGAPDRRGASGGGLEVGERDGEGELGGGLGGDVVSGADRAANQVERAWARRVPWGR